MAGCSAFALWLAFISFKTFPEVGEPSDQERRGNVTLLVSAGGKGMLAWWGKVTRGHIVTRPSAE